MAHLELQAFAKRFDLTIASAFVPYTRSRNAGEGWKSLNWIVSVVRGGKVILSVPYSAGTGHAPGEKIKKGADRAAVVAWEIENGFPGHMGMGGRVTRKAGSSPIVPDANDVLASLALDSDVLDRGSFASWASEFGYDTDSIKAKGIYDECLRIALALRAGLPSGAMDLLREAAQDY